LYLNRAIAAKKNASFTYIDVPQNHWARQSAEFLNKNNIFPRIKYFKGTSKALRYDIFISSDKLLAFYKIYAKLKKSGRPSFPDLPSAKDARESILRLAERGLIKGDSKGMLQGLKHVTRYEAAVFFNRLVNLINPAPLKKRSSSFSDLPSRHWAAKDVLNLTKFEIINGYKDSTFRGSGTITRYELAVILKKISDLLFSKNMRVIKKPSGKTQTGPDKYSSNNKTDNKTDKLKTVSLEKLFNTVKKCIDSKQKYEYGKWDCSRYVQYVFEVQGISLPRTSADQGKTGENVKIADLRPGDLLFFNYQDSSSKITHSGIYLGKWNSIQCAFTHNSWSDKKVIVTDLAKEYYLSRLVGAKRIARVR
jgi:hypothetical protein